MIKNNISTGNEGPRLKEINFNKKEVKNYGKE